MDQSAWIIPFGRCTTPSYLRSRTTWSRKDYCTAWIGSPHEYPLEGATEEEKPLRNTKYQKRLKEDDEVVNIFWTSLDNDAMAFVLECVYANPILNRLGSVYLRSEASRAIFFCHVKQSRGHYNEPGTAGPINRLSIEIKPSQGTFWRRTDS